MREHKVPCGNKVLRARAKFLKKRNGFVNKRKVYWGMQRFVSKHKVSWGMQRFYE